MRERERGREREREGERERKREMRGWSYDVVEHAGIAFMPKRTSLQSAHQHAPT